MIEKLLGLERCSILQCQQIAEKLGFDSLEWAAAIDSCV